MRISSLAMAVACLLSMSGYADDTSSVRTWTDATGKYRVEAVLVSSSDKEVVLKRADGTEVTVQVEKLSDADRSFLKKSADKSPATAATKNSASTNATEPAIDRDDADADASDAAGDNAKVREIAQDFLKDLRTLEKDRVKAVLTSSAVKVLEGGRSYIDELPVPDEAASSVRVGKAKIKGEEATVPATVRVQGDSRKIALLLRKLGAEWRVFGLSAKLRGQDVTIDFESELPDNSNTPLVEEGESLATLVGKKISLTGLTLHGQPVSLEAYRGKVVLIDFWATWCGPCREEIPNILSCYNAFHSEGFEVLAVSVDQDLGALAEFVKTENPPWTVLADRHPQNAKSMAKKFGITGIPAFILVDKVGNVAAVNCRGARLAQELTRLLP
ncbi:MAG: redoxin family protein [Pirellulales bacterium]